MTTGLDWMQIGATAGTALAGFWKGMRGASSADDSATIQFNRTLYLMKKQMEFQEMMSNTAHQREVADLKNAGLNPILSANSGASTPNGGLGTASMSNAGQIEAESGAKAIEAGINATNAGTALMSAKSQKQLNQAIEEKTNTERTNIAMDTEKKSAETTQLNIGNKYLPHQLKANILQTQGQTALNQAKTGEAMSATNLNYQRAELARSEKLLNDEETRRNQIENDLEDFKLQWRKDHPLMTNVEMTMDQWLTKAVTMGFLTTQAVAMLRQKPQIKSISQQKVNINKFGQVVNRVNQSTNYKY